MARVSITEVYEPPEVDLWGHIFVARPLTKDTEQKLDPLLQKAEEAFAAVEDGADLVAAVAAYFDVALKRSEDETKQAKPSTLLKKKWESSELSIEQLLWFFRAVQSAGGGIPPT